MYRTGRVNLPVTDTESLRLRDGISLSQESVMQTEHRAVPTAPLNTTLRCARNTVSNLVFIFTLTPVMPYRAGQRHSMY